MKYLFFICNCCAILTLLPVKRLIDSTVGKDAACHSPGGLWGCPAGRERRRQQLPQEQAALVSREVRASREPLAPCPAPPHIPLGISLIRWDTGGHAVARASEGACALGLAPWPVCLHQRKRMLSQPWSQEEDERWVEPSWKSTNPQGMKVSKCLLSHFFVLVLQAYYGRLPREH